MPRGGNDDSSQRAATLRRTDSPFQSDVASQRLALRCDVAGALPEPKFIGFYLYLVEFCVYFRYRSSFSMFEAVPHENSGAVRKMCLYSFLLVFAFRILLFKKIYSDHFGLLNQVIASLSSVNV